MKWWPRPACETNLGQSVEARVSYTNMRKGMSDLAVIAGIGFGRADGQEPTRYAKIFKDIT